RGRGCSHHRRPEPLQLAAVIFDRGELEARLKQLVAVIADENVRSHYQQDIRDRLNIFFQPQFQNRKNGDRRGGFKGN
ncbi:hypothetical protein, partial [Rhizobium leguminosarum]|uniref:hypothetical protein n=1 Tax=Rhizobium leguminosarum TaxID=384 RepID=UPI003F9E7A5D